MAKLAVYALLLLFACMFVFTQATPIEDIAETSIDVTETLTSPTTESFSVDVIRVDDLVNDEGDIVAERIEAVMIDFELNDNQLLVNNVPVELGITTVTMVEAKILPGGNNTELADELEQSFDIGLVTVEVSSSAESFPTDDPSYSLRRITIQTRIVEIDGMDIVQTDAVEKILEVKILNVLDDDSEDLEFALGPSDVKGAHKHSPCSLNTFVGRIRHWWRCSSRFTRVIIASIFLTSVFGLVFIALPTAAHALIVAGRRRQAAYRQIALVEEEETIKNEQVIYIADEEKRALMEQQTGEEH